MQKKIDDAANMWNKTKDPQYKDLWYKLIKEYVGGSYNFKRWNRIRLIPVTKQIDGTYVFVGKEIDKLQSIYGTILRIKSIKIFAINVNEMNVW